MPDINGDMKKFEEQNSMAFRFQHVLKATQSAPYERVMQGWFENYLNLKQFILLETVSVYFLLCIILCKLVITQSLSKWLMH